MLNCALYWVRNRRALNPWAASFLSQFSESCRSIFIPLIKWTVLKTSFFPRIAINHYQRMGWTCLWLLHLRIHCQSFVDYRQGALHLTTENVLHLPTQMYLAIAEPMILQKAAGRARACCKRPHPSLTPKSTSPITNHSEDRLRTAQQQRRA